MPATALVAGGGARITRHDLTDELLIEAIRVVVRSQSASVSLLQRRCYIGYATASRLVDRLEKLGVVGPQHGALPRDVLIAEDALPRVLTGLQARDAPVVAVEQSEAPSAFDGPKCGHVVGPVWKDGGESWACAKPAGHDLAEGHEARDADGLGGSWWVHEVCRPEVAR